MLAAGDQVNHPIAGLDGVKITLGLRIAEAQGEEPAVQRFDRAPGSVIRNQPLEGPRHAVVV